MDPFIQLEQNRGTKYVLLGYVRGCSYCFQSFAQLLSLNEGVFQEEFNVDINSRSWEGGISYNPDNMIITVDYQTDDLTEDCFCAHDPMDDEYIEYRDSNWEKSCFCIYKFTGQNFELMESSWKRIISDDDEN